MPSYDVASNIRQAVADGRTMVAAGGGGRVHSWTTPGRSADWQDWSSSPSASSAVVAAGGVERRSR